MQINFFGGLKTEEGAYTENVLDLSVLTLVFVAPGLISTTFEHLDTVSLVQLQYSLLH